jgi:hypothetical protein
MRMTRKILELSGIGSGRLHLEWVSSAEAQRFAEVATHVTESVRSLGKLETDSLGLQLNAAEKTLNGENMRWMVGKENTLIKKGDVYGRKWDQEKLEAAIDSSLEREYHKNLIYCAIKDGYTSVRDISQKIGLELKRISYLLADMEKTSMVSFKGMEDKKPVFAAI